MKRCKWCLSDPLYIKYHDLEWGKPVHNDRVLFEMINLEGAQAGLSWITVLKKRENYRLAFDNFDWNIIASYDVNKISELLQNSGIIRNRLKINSVICNAKATVKIIEKYGSLDNYLWQFTDGKTILNHWDSVVECPTSTKESDNMSKNLKKEGFKFVGTTICYSFMQAVGMVNDHIEECCAKY